MFWSHTQLNSRTIHLTHSLATPSIHSPTPFSHPPTYPLHSLATPLIHSVIHPPHSLSALQAELAAFPHPEVANKLAHALAHAANHLAAPPTFHRSVNGASGGGALGGEGSAWTSHARAKSQPGGRSKLVWRPELGAWTSGPHQSGGGQGGSFAVVAEARRLRVLVRG